MRRRVRVLLAAVAALAALAALAGLAACTSDDGVEVVDPGPAPPTAPETETEPDDDGAGPTVPSTTAPSTTTAPPPTGATPTSTPPETASVPATVPATVPPTEAPPPASAPTTPPVGSAALGPMPAAETYEEAAVRFVVGQLEGRDTSLLGEPSARRDWAALGLPGAPRWTGEVRLSPERNEQTGPVVVCGALGDTSRLCVVELRPGPGDDVPHLLLDVALTDAEYSGPFEVVPGTEHPPMAFAIDRSPPG